MKRASVLMTIVVMLAGTAVADVYPFMPADPYDSTPDSIPTARDKNDGNPDIFDAVNQLVPSLALTDNEQLDARFVQPDYVWEEYDGKVALIGLTAGNSNTLGYYTDPGVGAAKTPIIGPYSGFGFLGSGTVADPYPATPFDIASDGLFGWYLKSNSAYYYSESGLNPNGWDHLMTFKMPELAGETIYIDTDGDKNTQEAWTLVNPYLLAWEDLNLGDEDYDDMIYIVDGVVPVPLPGAALLGVLGLGAAGAKLRRRRTA